MKPLFHFLISLPTGDTFTWIGSGLKPSKSPGKVWLTLPNGSPVLELPKSMVQPTTLAHTAARITEDHLTDKAPLN